MTRKDAIRIIRKMLACTDLSVRANLNADMVDACHMAIKALEQEPCCNCIEFKRYAKEMGFEIEQESILDKIRAELQDVAFDSQEIDGEHESIMIIDLNDALNIIDKHKAESNIEKRKPCINYSDGCEEWAGCPCVYYKAENEVSNGNGD